MSIGKTVVEILSSVVYLLIGLWAFFAVIDFSAKKIVQSGKTLIDYHAQVREQFYKGVRSDIEPKPSTFPSPHRQGTN
jgi:hypothetical protein